MKNHHQKQKKKKEKSSILDSTFASQFEQARDEQPRSSARKEEDCEDDVILLDST
jgi:hypothetical protein